MEPIPRLIVGLGNPTTPYQHTRHNIGREFINHAARSQKQSFERFRQAEIVRLSPDLEGGLSSPIVLAKLDLFMNQSGEAVKSLADAFQISPDNVLAVVDDFMIPLGSLRLRAHGSSGGHNGLKSIIEFLGTEEFGRLRIGVGPVPPTRDPAEFVLEPFTTQEQSLLPQIFEIIQQCVKVLLKQGYQRAMGATNKVHI